MGRVTVELTGEEARLLRSLDKVVERERKLGEAAGSAGRESAKASKEAQGGLRGQLGEIRGVVAYRCYPNYEQLYYAKNVGSDEPNCDEWYREQLDYVGCYGEITGFGGCDVCDHDSTVMLITAL